MPLESTSTTEKLNMQTLGFRHSDSVKNVINDLAEEHNLSQADMIRQIFNKGLGEYGITIRANRVVQ